MKYKYLEYDLLQLHNIWNENFCLQTFKIDKSLQATTIQDLKRKLLSRAIVNWHVVNPGVSDRQIEKSHATVLNLNVPRQGILGIRDILFTIEEQFSIIPLAHTESILKSHRDGNHNTWSTWLKYFQRQCCVSSCNYLSKILWIKVCTYRNKT